MYTRDNPFRSQSLRLPSWTDISTAFEVLEAVGELHPSGYRSNRGPVWVLKMSIPVATIGFALPLCSRAD